MFRSICLRHSKAPHLLTRALSAAFLLAASALPAHADIATIYDLGAFPSGSNSAGVAINASGQVAGTALTGAAFPGAFLYTGTPGSGGVMVNLGTLGGTFTYGRAINARGQVVGQSYTAGNSADAFLYTGIPGQGGAMADLGPGDAYAVNDAGQVVGWSAGHAFLYTGIPGSGGAMADLGTLGGTASLAEGINAVGQITGYSWVSGSTNPHAILYTGIPGSGGAMADLGTLGGSRSIGRAINAGGQITGESNITGDTAQHAFLYAGIPGSGGAMADLDLLGGIGSRGGAGYAINSAGQVVGDTFVMGPTGYHQTEFLYVGTPGSGGHMIDLNAWLDANNPIEGAKWTLISAYGLTDTGLITGTGYYDDGINSGDRAYLLDASALTNVPEPTSLTLLTLGVITLLHRRRRAPIHSER